MAVAFTGDYKRTAEYRMFPEDIVINANLNGRHDTPDIEFLINDILKHGQHTPVVIRKDGGAAVLVAGFSRWRAISEINKQNLAPVKLAVRCTYLQCNENDGFLVNLSENRVRNPTTPLDDAHNIKRLLNVYAMTEEQVAAIYFPAAKSADDIKAALVFVRERISLISLTPEAEEAVRTGRVKGTAAQAISKLSKEQQAAVLKKPGAIKRKDVQAASPAGKKPKSPKKMRRDAELMRRIHAVLEDVEGILPDDDCPEFVEIDRSLLRNLSSYVNQINALPA